jgi:hypothetical protein
MDFQPEFIEGVQFDCQYFDKLNMTIKLTFEIASFYLKSFFLPGIIFPVPLR